MTASFMARTMRAIERVDSRLCVGLDPDSDRIFSLAPELAQRDGGITTYLEDVVGATRNVAAAYKLNKPFYDILPTASDILRNTVDSIRKQAPHALVILDCKIGDIDNTMRFYLEKCFSQLGVDAVLLNPYMGSDVWSRVAAFPGRAAGILVRTSNPAATELQDAVLEDGSRVWQRVLALMERATANGAPLFPVVSFQSVDDAHSARSLVPPEIPFLYAGVGTQGGDSAIAKALLVDHGPGPLITVSRGIMYPPNADGDYRLAIEGAAESFARDFCP